MPQKNLRLWIAYDGTSYKGWESQHKDDCTVQGRLESVLTRMTGGADVKLIASGRTDAGVHALAQCANIHLDTKLSAAEVKEYLNRYLPDTIAVTKADEVSARFHARYNCKAKTYRYTCYAGTSKPVFERKFVTHLPEQPDAIAIAKAASYLQGTNDYKSFTNNTRMTKSSVRTIFHADCVSTENLIPMEVRLHRDFDRTNLSKQTGGRYLTFEFHGDGFLRTQIRIMVGTLLEIGYGHRAPEDVPGMLRACDRAVSGPAAPPQGLCLMEVEY